MAASTRLALDVETERCCTVLGGPWQFLPIATMHMAVWWASASGTEERPSSRVSVSWELGVGPALKSVSQSDGGGAAGCGGWGRGGSRDKGCEALGGAGAAAGAGAPGPAGWSSACGLARRAAAVMAVEMLGVRIEPSSFRWFNSVYHRWADRGHGAGTGTWGLAGSKTQLSGGAGLKRYGVPHQYPLGSRWALFASGIFLGRFPALWHPDFCGFSVKYPRNRHFSSFWAGDDVRRLRYAAPDRSFISRFLRILINFLIDLSFLEI